MAGAVKVVRACGRGRGQSRFLSSVPVPVPDVSTAPDAVPVPLTVPDPEDGEDVSSISSHVQFLTFLRRPILLLQLLLIPRTTGNCPLSLGWP